uniref:NADH dehydrogenase [ubiquinone] 1 alpha subcomplex assembly factor 8 n=1 Tax=Anas zonorhyncha TaxID=75864 RepID=A0A8B9TYY7_9AVES
MSGRGVWLRARARLRRFPALLGGCGEQAAAYGRCVAAASAGSGEVRRDGCLREFRALRECFNRAVRGENGEITGLITGGGPGWCPPR